MSSKIAKIAEGHLWKWRVYGLAVVVLFLIVQFHSTRHGIDSTLTDGSGQPSLKTFSNGSGLMPLENGALLKPAGRSDSQKAGVLPENPHGTLRNVSPPSDPLEILRHDLRRAIGLEDPILRSEVMEQLSAAVADELVPSTLRTLSPDELGTEFGALLVRRWGSVEPRSAGAWIASLGDESLRSQFSLSLAVVWAGSDPVSAAQFAMESIQDVKVQSDALVSIVQRWAQQTPEAAARWVEEFPESGLRGDAVANLVQIWAQHDVFQTGEWLRTLPLDAARDEGARAFAETLVHRYPQLAADWAVTIQDATHRQTKVHDLFGQWLATDPARPWEWLNSAPISANFKQQLKQGFHGH